MANILYRNMLVGVLWQLLMVTVSTNTKWVVLADNVSSQVQCSNELMRVEIPLTVATIKNIYISGLKEYPDPACRPRTDATGQFAVFEFDLNDVYRCAVTRVVNRQTGKKIYYQTVIVEKIDEAAVAAAAAANSSSTSIPYKSQSVHVKCSTTPVHGVSRRNVVFPAGFEEPIDIETTTSLIGIAPQPNITVGVRQAGRLVTGELNVSPGTPLQMEISLDPASTSIYGLLVTHMRVSDTKAQEETIIYNGCSIDPYLFENFNTIDGDNLVAKFRAFKFPDSTYVQFKGTVNVCLDKCKGVECSDGQTGYGRRRRRREINSLPADPNKIFEITITSFIKVNFDDDSLEIDKIIKKKNTPTKSYLDNETDNKLIVSNQVVTQLTPDNENDVRFHSKMKNAIREDHDNEQQRTEQKEKDRFTSEIMADEMAQSSSSPLLLYYSLSIAICCCVGLFVSNLLYH